MDNCYSTRLSISGGPGSIKMMLQCMDRKRYIPKGLGLKDIHGLTTLELVGRMKKKKDAMDMQQ